MRAIVHRIQGKQINVNGQNGLILDDASPARNGSNFLYLRYAFVTLGTRNHVFPAFLLDDWGAEVKGVELYRWFQRHANEFPRAEVFGFEQDGSESQRFMREFEHYVKLPCYLYEDKGQPIQEGILISHILLSNSDVSSATKLEKAPKDKVAIPLRRASVSWWHIPMRVDIDELTINGLQIE